MLSIFVYWSYTLPQAVRSYAPLQIIISQKGPPSYCILYSALTYKHTLVVKRWFIRVQLLQYSK